MRTFVALTFCLLADSVAAQVNEVSAYVAGVAALEAEDYEEAIRWFEEVLKENPNHADAHYGLALAFAADSPLHNERKVIRELERALQIHPEQPEYLEAQLSTLRRTMHEASAFSTTDARRPSLARRLLAADSTNALAHEELALNAFLEFDWRRQMARGQGGWSPDETHGTSGAANRARLQAEVHLVAALRTNPTRVESHRLRLRLAVLAEDDLALGRAAAAFAESLTSDPDALLYQGLAAYRMDEIAAADEYFETALAEMPGEERAEFERIAHLLRDGEAALALADSNGATQQFWRTRDPLLLSPQNERKLEHFARLALADLLYADARTGTRGWATPRGEVVVRYGMPDESGRWLGADFSSKRFGALERWVYDELGEEGGFSLLFEDPFRNGAFDFMSSAAGEDDATRARSLFHRVPERFAYRPLGGLVDFAYSAIPFKGAAGRTTLVVPVGIPVVPQLAQSEPTWALGLQSGVFLLAPNGVAQAEVRHEIERIHAASILDTGTGLSWTDGFSISALPGAYTMAVEFEQSATGAVGVRRDHVVLRDFASLGLSLSGLLPAYLIEEVEPQASARPGWVHRGGFAIHASPTGRFGTDEPIYLYLEVYGLRVNNGHTNYEIEAVLRPIDDAGVISRTLARLFGRRPPSAVSVQFSVSGSASDEGQYVILDASTQEVGEYELTLRVRDENADKIVETSCTLQLRSP